MTQPEPVPPEALVPPVLNATGWLANSEEETVLVQLAATSGLQWPGKVDVPPWQDTVLPHQ